MTGEFTIYDVQFTMRSRGLLARGLQIFDLQLGHADYTDLIEN